MRLGKKIEGLRRAKKMTRKELAAKAGISVSYLRKIESGNCSIPPIKTLSRIAFALNVSVKYIE